MQFSTWQTDFYTLVLFISFDAWTSTLHLTEKPILHSILTRRVSPPRTCFGHWNELWRPLTENTELQNAGFLRPPLQIYVPASPTTAWSCGLIIQSYCSLTCDVIFWTRRAKQTWTVRNQRAILQVSLVFAQFWKFKGENHRLRWLCRTSTDWIWESQILRVARLREGRNAHFTESYFMHFVPREIRTTGRCTTYWL